MYNDLSGFSWALANNNTPPAFNQAYPYISQPFIQSSLGTYSLQSTEAPLPFLDRVPSYINHMQTVSNYQPYGGQSFPQRPIQPVVSGRIEQRNHYQKINFFDHPQIIFNNQFLVQKPTVEKNSQDKSVFPQKNNNAKVQKKVYVLKDTAYEINPDENRYKPYNIECISRGELNKRPLCVIKDTAQVVNPYDYQGREDLIEHIPATVKNLREIICVRKDTGKEVDPNDYQDRQELIEFMSRSTKYRVFKRQDNQPNPSVKRPRKKQSSSEESKKRELNNPDDKKTKKRKRDEQDSNAEKKNPISNPAVNVDGSKVRIRLKQIPEPVIQIKKEPNIEKVVYRPVLTLNIAEFRKVSQILRGDNNIAATNCAYLAEDFIKYLDTREIPKLATTAKECSLDHFMTNIEWEKIPIRTVKKEPGSQRSTDMICKSVINRNISFQVPPGQSYGEENEQVDLETSVYDVDHCNQISCSYDKLDEALKAEASRSLANVSFGMVNLGRCSKYITNPGHMIVYFATPDKITYIDCQLSDPIFNDIKHAFEFAATAKNIMADTFGNIVFYLPMIKGHLLTHDSILDSQPDSSFRSIYGQFPSPILFQPAACHLDDLIAPSFEVKKRR